MKIIRLALLLLGLLHAAPAVAAPPVRQLKGGSPNRDYQDAAAAAGFPWGEDSNNETVTHVYLRLERYRMTLSIGLPAPTPRARADAWLQSLADDLGWSRVRLYSYQDGRSIQVRARAPMQAQFVNPFQQRAALDLNLLQSRLKQIAPNPVLLGVRAVGATVTTVAPAPAARATHGGATYLFYSLPAAPPGQLAITYGYSTRQIVAVVMAILLWLLFPAAPLLAYRSHLLRQEDLPDDERQRAYERWQRGVRIAGVVGAFLTFLLLGSPALGVRTSTSSIGGLPLLFPLWWWYGAVIKMISLPGAPAGLFPRWLSAGGEAVLALIMAAVFVVPPLPWITVAGGAANLIPLVAGSALALAAVAGVIYTAVWVQKIPRRADNTALVTEDVPEDPEGLREALRKLTARAEAEGEEAPPTFPSGVPQFAMERTLALHAVTQSLDPDQRAALTASGILASRGEAAKAWAPLLGLICVVLPMVATGIAVWFVPSSMRMLTLLVGAGVMLAAGAVTAWRANATLKKLHLRQEEADVKVAGAMDEPVRLLDALRRIEECDRAHQVPGAETPSTPSVFSERRQRLARRLDRE